MSPRVTTTSIGGDTPEPSWTGSRLANGFTDILIKSLLESTGFVNEQITIRDEWLFLIRARKTFDCHIEEIFHLNDKDFVTEVYKIFLGRLPDEGGLQHYLKILKDGITREAVIELIKDSEEYKSKQK